MTPSFLENVIGSSLCCCSYLSLSSGARSGVSSSLGLRRVGLDGGDTDGDQTHDRAAQLILEDSRWSALLSRDRNVDGKFFYSVASMGVYCRPSGGARTPRPENVSFYRTSEEAEAAGYRACKRCKPELPELGIESREHAGRLEHAGLGESVKERAFACVGVADHGDDGHRDCLAALSLLMTNATDCGKLALNLCEAEIDLAAIGLKLGFARATGSDAAAKLRDGATASRQARQLVFELCEFYLKLPLAGLGMAGENVEDELRTVDDVAGQPNFDVAELRGCEVVIEENKRRVGGGDDLDNFVELRCRLREIQRVRPCHWPSSHRESHLGANQTLSCA